MGNCFTICCDSINYQLDKKKLNALDEKKIKKFVPKLKNVRVVKVYDGDTITVIGFIHKKPYKFSIRLNSIDAPEIKELDESKYAIIARDKLSEQIFGKVVTLSNISIEKYGRVLATIHYKNVCYNDWMLENHYAVPYDGGTKAKIDWKKYMRKKRKQRK